MERGGPYLSSSTKIIEIGGLNVKILEGVVTTLHPNLDSLIFMQNDKRKVTK